MGWQAIAGGVLGGVGSAWDSISDLWGGTQASRDAQQANADSLSVSLQNMEFQKQLATHGIRWRVEDAVAAGLHPLVGAGVNPTSYSPSHYIPGSVPRSRDAGEGLSRMGQDISRAQLAKATQGERDLNSAMRDKVIAETDQSRAQAAESRARTLRDSLPPPIPSMYKAYQDQHGRIQWAYNPEYALGLSANPMKMYGMGFRDVFGGPDTNSGPFNVPPRSSTNTWSWGGR